MKIIFERLKDLSDKNKKALEDAFERVRIMEHYKALNRRIIADNNKHH